MQHLLLVVTISLFFIQTSVLAADNRGLAVHSTSGKRVALVIGNDSYKSLQALNNARADARSIARALEQAGFQVTLRLDTDLSTLKASLRTFKSQVSGGDEAVFYYSGHGVQLAASNYLLPVDIRSDSEEQVKDDAVPLQRVLDDLQEQKARFTLAIVDACRNNPFKQTGRAIGGRGLAPTTAATGQMVLYSAGTGQQALDRLGNNDTNPNGVFTRIFLKEMERQGVSVSEVLRSVREEVVEMAKTVGHEQVPALYDQSLGTFYFRRGEGRPAATGSRIAPPDVKAPAVRTASQIEEDLWVEIADSDDAAVFREYLKQYPKGRHASQAKVKIAKLKGRRPLEASRPAQNPVPPASPGGSDDNEASLWKAVDGGGLRDDYKVYLTQYPKGRYLALARARLKKFDDEATAAEVKKEQEAWADAERDNSETAYQNYINRYPSGKYAALIPSRLSRLKTETAVREEETQWKNALASSTSAAMRGYLEKYPNGRHVELARQKEEEYRRTPTRPVLPFTVSETVWKTLESSEAYRNLPRPRPIKVTSHSTSQLQYTGSKSRTLATPKPTDSSEKKEFMPLGDKCYAMNNTYSYSDLATSTSYLCGNVLNLGFTTKSGSNGVIESIDELKGSLFPMQIGAQQSVRYKLANTKNHTYDMVMTSACRVTDRGLAKDLHPKLTGVAWKVQCQGSNEMSGKTYPHISDDYFIEDLSIFLSAIGQMKDNLDKKMVIPVPGSSTVIEAKGEYGSRNTKVYSSYDWTVGE